MTKTLDMFRAWAAAAPPPDLTLKGSCDVALGADHVCIVVFDSNGRMYQLHDCKIRDGTLHYVQNPRREIARLLDSYGFPIVEPDWSAARREHP